MQIMPRVIFLQENHCHISGREVHSLRYLPIPRRDPHSKTSVVLLTPAVLPATTLHLRSGVGHQTLGTLARGLTLLGDAHGPGAAGVRLARVAGWCASGARRGVGR